ncbi:MAG: hypothetical protein HC771_21585, partial [Synechococcales cyanobacterium CRU_2_2]|nr:hypothetical protein [Synechococcales cyanobacterium CRU_2_2]
QRSDSPRPGRRDDGGKGGRGKGRGDREERRPPVNPVFARGPKPGSKKKEEPKVEEVEAVTEDVEAVTEEMAAEAAVSEAAVPEAAVPEAAAEV